MRREEERLLSLWVTMPNYARIVYGYVPPWHWTRTTGDRVASKGQS